MNLSMARRGSTCAGSALVAVLWCMILLGLFVTSLLHSTRLNLRVAKNSSSAIEAHYLALAGVERTKALIFQEAKSLKASGQIRPSAHLNDPGSFRDVQFGKGMFRVVRPGMEDEGAGNLVHGVSAEESRLNVNVASEEELRKVRGLSGPVAAAILDWRDGDSELTPGGAEREEYAARSPPYVPRNQPLESLKELLMVRGVTPELLFGEDMNSNGILDPEENDGEASMPLDNADGRLERGWSDLLTADSAARDVNARGESRVNLKTAGEAELAAVAGISSELAKAIVAHRSERAFESLVDLLEVAEPRREGEAQPPQQPSPERTVSTVDGLVRVRAAEAPAQEAPPPPPQQPQGGGSRRKLVSETLFKEIAGDLTVEEGGRGLTGPVDLNTAPRSVLACLPGMTEDLARAVVDRRLSSGHYSNIGYLLDVPGMTREVLKSLAPRVTVRSETFRISSEGLVPSTGARRRIEVVVRLGTFDFETLEYQEGP
jgi:DNA uptake protein ComE-like DNA-binding protein